MQIAHEVGHDLDAIPSVPQVPGLFRGIVEDALQTEDVVAFVLHSTNDRGRHGPIGWKSALAVESSFRTQGSYPRAHDDLKGASVPLQHLLEERERA
jgi:hypothetical protein